MVNVRSPKDSDSQDLATLLTQLGYPAGEKDLPSRLAAMRDDPNVALFVAELDDKVVGVATAHVIHSIHKSEPVAMLTVLVVDETVRGQGVGKQLVERAEDWALMQGATAISLTSALRRVAAHAFYISMGYEQNGVRLAKTLRTTA